MKRLVTAAGVVASVLAFASTSFAQPPSAPPRLAQGTPGTQNQTGQGMMGGQDQGTGTPTASPEGGCSMMRNMASLKERVRQLEQRLSDQPQPPPQPR